MIDLRPRPPRTTKRGDHKQRAEYVASPHSITWSARASSEGGMVSPSAFALFRLIRAKGQPIFQFNKRRQ